MRRLPYPSGKESCPDPSYSWPAHLLCLVGLHLDRYVGHIVSPEYGPIAGLRVCQVCGIQQWKWDRRGEKVVRELGGCPPCYFPGKE